MKKLMMVVFTMLLAGSLSFAQAGAGSTDAQAHKGAQSGKKATKTTKAHKGGKKNKKGNGGSTTTPPPK